MLLLKYFEINLCIANNVNNNNNINKKIQRNDFDVTKHLPVQLSVKLLIKEINKNEKT